MHLPFSLCDPHPGWLECIHSSCVLCCFGDVGLTSIALGDDGGDGTFERNDPNGEAALDVAVLGVRDEL